MIFDKRIEVKPYEYPEILWVMKAVREAYWVVDEWTFSKDVHEYMVEMTEAERGIFTRTMLAIAQIEVAVKKFWGKIDELLPKPEVSMVGYTLAENEVRHMESYSKILEILGLEGMFKEVLSNDVMKGRASYLEKYLKKSSSNPKEAQILNLMLFTAFIENTSLYSQFLLGKSYAKHRQIMKDVDNVIKATSIEEDIHFKFGIELILIIKREYPELFTDELYAKIKEATVKAYEAESKILDWIYGGDELPFAPRAMTEEFLKDRFNQSVAALGIEPVFVVDENLLGQTEWFMDEIKTYNRNDFFDTQSINYSKKTQAITLETVFPNNEQF